MILRKETETINHSLTEILIKIRMNDTPQGDGNAFHIDTGNNICLLIRMNDTPQGDGN